MRKEDLSTDTTFDPCWFSLDYTFNIFFKAYRIPNNAKAVSGSERKRKKIFGYTTLYEFEIFKGGLDRCKEKNRGPKSRTNVALMELKG